MTGWEHNQPLKRSNQIIFWCLFSPQICGKTFPLFNQNLINFPSHHAWSPAKVASQNRPTENLRALVWWLVLILPSCPRNMRLIALNTLFNTHFHTCSAKSPQRLRRSRRSRFSHLKSVGQMFGSPPDPGLAISSAHTTTNALLSSSSSKKSQIQSWNHSVEIQLLSKLTLAAAAASNRWYWVTGHERQ